MVKVVTGTLGSGKTLFCVTEMFERFCAGRYVCTNVALNWDEIVALAAKERGVHVERRQWVEVDPEKTPDWHVEIPWGLPGSPIDVYLDEIHLFFNARDWAATAKLHKSMLAFLTQSRKAAVDVTFIAQEITTIEKQFRDMAEWEYRVVSTDHMPLGVLGKLPIKAFCVGVRSAKTGQLVKRIWRSYNKRLFKLYGSFTFLDAEMNAIAAEVPRLAPIKLKRVSMWQRLGLHVRSFLHLCIPALKRTNA